MAVGTHKIALLKFIEYFIYRACVDTTGRYGREDELLLVTYMIEVGTLGKLDQRHPAIKTDATLQKNHLQFELLPAGGCALTLLVFILYRSLPVDISIARPYLRFVVISPTHFSCTLGVLCPPPSLLFPAFLRVLVRHSSSNPVTVAVFLLVTNAAFVRPGAGCTDAIWFPGADLFTAKHAGRAIGTRRQLSHTILLLWCVAAEVGIEPTSDGPEPTVLPLNCSTIKRGRVSPSP